MYEVLLNLSRYMTEEAKPGKFLIDPKKIIELIKL